MKTKTEITVYAERGYWQGAKSYLSEALDPDGIVGTPVNGAPTDTNSNEWRQYVGTLWADAVRNLHQNEEPESDVRVYDEYTISYEDVEQWALAGAAEHCPTCGHKLKRKKVASEARSNAARENGKKAGGRPIDPNSKRQQALKAKRDKEE